MSSDQQQFAFDFGDAGKGEKPSVDGGKKTTKRRRKPSPAATPEEAISVAALNAKIKSVVESSMGSLWVEGEIADLARPRSGHLYFTLKDEEASLRAVMWRSTAEKLPFDMEDGQSVVCQGNVEVYAARGSVQLIVRKCQPQGMGPLQFAFAQLQARLAAEGLFDPGLKRPLPRIPKRIAIVTSPAGAAIHDFLQATAARHAGVEIILIPSSVQGPGSMESLIAGIEAAHALSPRPDVLIVSRGGGSLEDLWSFNEEPFVRALAASEIPTVSAVGHEVDVTLSDLVADVRALTPTDAASRVLPDRDALLMALDALHHTAQVRMRERLRRADERLNWLSSRPVLSKPIGLIHDRSRAIDDWDLRARRAIWQIHRDAAGQLSTAAASVSALSPLSVLSRGYSVTQDESGRVIRRTSDVQTGQRLKTRLQNGFLDCEVTGIQEMS